jgi:ABC-type Fe3+-hydroxamate transport system substrate-binding protein
MAIVARLTDARSRVLDFVQAPRRIVSLVPSDTFTVAALGCADRLVGRTDYCEWPASPVASVPAVGGTKNPRVADVLALAPDLVLANQEENTRGDVLALEQGGLRVHVSFPKRVADGIAHVAKLARVLGVHEDADVRALVRRGYEVQRAADADRGARPPLRTFCPIWMDPLMTIHGDTFVSDMLDVCGMANVFADRVRRYPLAADVGAAAAVDPARLGDRDTRYPRITVDELVARAPAAIVLPDEPYAFTEADAGFFRALPLPAGPRGAVRHTNGRDVTWYGAWSIEAIERVRALAELLRA